MQRRDAESGRARFRDVGGRVGGLETGRHNAITDVEGVEVGHATVSHGDPPGKPGQGPARTGVTAIWPGRRGVHREPVAAGTSVLSGTGEIISMTEIDELGMLASPVMLTNSMQIGAVYDATVRYLIAGDPEIGATNTVVMPVVGECDDSFLNDSRGLHVTQEHVRATLDSATTGPVAEGCVGSGTGMVCHEFKGGIGTSSRVVQVDGGVYTVGVLVMANYGRRRRLTISGIPAGAYFSDLMPEPGTLEEDAGSAIVIVATDAPLQGQDLSRLARRASFGLVRTGSTGSNGSGEIALAFSTGRSVDQVSLLELGMRTMDGLFEAALDATEEAVLNSLCMATTTVGRAGNTVHAIPLDRLAALLSSAG